MRNWHIEQAAAGALGQEGIEAVEVSIQIGGGPVTVSARFAQEVLQAVYGEQT